MRGIEADERSMRTIQIFDYLRAGLDGVPAVDFHDQIQAELDKGAIKFPFAMKSVKPETFEDMFDDCY